jgi:[ribosomal protein S18]-alanine N-acetyltransferase
MPMRETDIEPVIVLENLSFSKPWRRSGFIAELTSPVAINLVARQSGWQNSETVIAYSCAQLVIDELSLLKIAVSPAWRCKGVGTQLLLRNIDMALQKDAAKVFLEVRPSNQAALAFYLNSGFRIVGKRPNYYPETGEDALVMMKRLDDQTRLKER